MPAIPQDKILYAINKVSSNRRSLTWSEPINQTQFTIDVVMQSKRKFMNVADVSLNLRSTSGVQKIQKMFLVLVVPAILQIPASNAE